jgi:hypothetical protein
MTEIERLVERLARTPVDPARAVNQYARGGLEGRANAVRRRNLQLYLEELAGCGPDTILIGEAVSHRGGRLTGIPFCSETVLLGGIPLLSGGRALGAEQGYERATATARLSTEASATMVWSTIRSVQPLPLLWNAFPFHPFLPGKPLSNRVPTAAELACGRPFVETLLGLFGIATVVAVGNQASRSLTALGIAHEKLRHPSMGGKQQFVAGMARLSQRRIE